VIEPAFAELAPLVHTKRACLLLGKPRATHYRRRRPRPSAPTRPRPPNALSPTERQQVLDVLHEPRFCDLPPAQVWARLLDDGIYLASISTMYRLLRAQGRAATGAGSATIPPGSSRSWSPPDPTTSGAGISPSSLDPTAAASSTCT
jgi:putative transposase